MKTLWRFAATTTLNLILGAACFAQHYTQTNLVANTARVAPVTDPQLVNPWGLARNSGRPGWVSDNATDLSTLYTTPPEPSSLWSSVSRQPIRLTRTRRLAHRPAPSPTAVKQISWWPQANQPYSSSPRLTGQSLDGTQLWR